MTEPPKPWPHDIPQHLWDDARITYVRDMQAIANESEPVRFMSEDVAMLYRLGPILQAFARQNPGDPLWDDAHAAFYHAGRLAAKIEAHLAVPPRQFAFPPA